MAKKKKTKKKAKVQKKVKAAPKKPKWVLADRDDFCMAAHTSLRKYSDTEWSGLMWNLWHGVPDKFLHSFGNYLHDKLKERKPRNSQVTGGMVMEICDEFQTHCHEDRKQMNLARDISRRGEGSEGHLIRAFMMVLEKITIRDAHAIAYCVCWNENARN